MPFREGESYDSPFFVLARRLRAGLRSACTPSVPKPVATLCRRYPIFPPDDLDFTLHTLIATLPAALIGPVERRNAMSITRAYAQLVERLSTARARLPDLRTEFAGAIS